MKRADMTAKEYQEYLRAKKGRAKYRAKPIVLQGVRYASKLEGRVATALLHMKRKGLVRDVQRQFPVDLFANATYICRYYVDFRVIHHDHSVTFVEAKGLTTPTWRLKWRLFLVALEEMRQHGHNIHPAEVWRVVQKGPKTFFRVTFDLAGLDGRSAPAVVRNERGVKICVSTGTKLAETQSLID